jgi:hypothetical protein
MGLFDLFKKKPSAEDDLASFLADMSALTTQNGLDVDELPSGVGEFGLDRSNPVPTKFATGSMDYLSRLRTLDGNPIKFERSGSTSAPNIEQMIDAYSITDSKGRSLGSIYICMYHKRNSRKAPKGFKLIPG